MLRSRKDARTDFQPSEVLADFLVRAQWYHLEISRQDLPRSCQASPLFSERIRFPDWSGFHVRGWGIAEQRQATARKQIRQATHCRPTAGTTSP
eukprot:3934159-Rhodomonas_salina.2